MSIIKKNLYYELSRPEQSGYRWEKIYDRLHILNNIYPTEKSTVNYECIKIPTIYNGLTKNILNYIKDSKNPIIDSSHSNSELPTTLASNAPPKAKQSKCSSSSSSPSCSEVYWSQR